MKFRLSNLLTLLFAVCALKCGAPDNNDLRGDNGCNPYNGTGLQCERANFKLIDPAESFEALSKQEFTWDEVAGAATYEIIISPVEDCSEPTQTISNITEAKTKIKIEETGEYYICLSMTDAAGIQYEALNSGTLVTITDSTVAIISYGKENTVAFGERVVGLEVFASIPLANVGVTIATELGIVGLADPFFYRGEKNTPGTFPGKEGTCTTSIELGTNCSVSIAYNSSASGSFEQEITISYNNGTEVVEEVLILSGSAITAGTLTFTSADAYDFGDVTTAASVDKSFTLSNTGDVDVTTITPATVSMPFAYKGGEFPGTGGDCSTTLTPGSSCTFIMTFAPATIGSSLMKLTINFLNGAGSQSVGKSITGTAIAP